MRHLRPTARWLLPLLLAGGACTQAGATQCTGSVTFRLPALNVSPYASEIGTPVSAWGTRSGSGVNCSETNTDLRGGHIGELSLALPSRVGTYTEGGVAYDVFPTNIAGIGFVIGYQRRGGASATASGHCGGAWMPMLAGPAPQASMPVMTGEPCAVMRGRQNLLAAGKQRGGSFQMINFSYTVRVRFIRTAARIGSGSINTGGFGTVCYREYLHMDSYGQGRPPFNRTQGHCSGTPFSDTGTVPVPAAPTCQFTNGLNRTITMATAWRNAYQGVGSTTTPTPFRLDVSCRHATRLTYRFDGQTVYLPSVLRNLGVSLPANQSLGVAAQGIGVQLMDAANNPVNMGTVYPVLGNINTPLTLHFALRYMFIAGPRQLRAGDVTVRATINVAYE